jgi:hypothetical protein
MIRELSLNIAFNDALAKVYRPLSMPESPLAVLADINEHTLMIFLQMLSGLIHGHFPDARAGILHDLEEPRGVCFVLSEGKRLHWQQVT